MEELNHLPYLENVVREVLRLYSPVHQSVRVAVQDDVVQLDKPFVDVKGVTQHELRYVDVEKFLSSSDRFGRADYFVCKYRIRKGDLVTVPIMRLHKSKEIWGEDAAEFRYVSFCRLSYNFSSYNLFDLNSI
jgi:hypothetical protein